MSILRFAVVLVGLAYSLHRIHVYEMTISTLHILAPFLRIVFFHTIVKKYVKILWLHIRPEEQLAIVLPATGTVAVFKKRIHLAQALEAHGLFVSGSYSLQNKRAKSPLLQLKKTIGSGSSRRSNHIPQFSRMLAHLINSATGAKHGLYR